MAKQTVTLHDVEIPDGYQPTGELRKLKTGECGCNGKEKYLPWIDPRPTSDVYIVLRRKEPPAIQALRKVKAFIQANEWKYSPHECYQLCENAIREWESSTK